MEWVYIGIMVAVGWYLAPYIIITILAIVGGVGYSICKLFGNCE